jgi:hypothetical protein
MRARVLVALLACSSLAPGAASAAIRSARVAWMPGPGAGIVGYNVWVREAGDGFTLPIDAGLPTLVNGNQMRREIPGLDDTRDYAFAVTGYLADGSQTALSNQILLPARTPPPGSCSAATTISPGGGTVTGRTTGEGSESGSCGASALAPERVFAWTPTVSGTATIQTCSASATTFDTILYVRGGRCDGPELACSDDASGCGAGGPNNNGSRVTLPVIADTTYYIVVDGHAGGRGDFSLTVTPPAPEPTCRGNVLPADGGTFTGTTGAASSQAGSCEGSTGLAPERVYQWTPTVSGTATIQTCNASATTFDTVLYVRGESCTGPELACNDDTPTCTVSAYSEPGDQGSRVRVPVVAGTPYFIVVDGYGGARGDYTLTVTPPVQTGCDAIPVPSQGGTFTGTTSGWGIESSGSCAATDAAPGRIYAWTPSITGIATVQTCNAGATSFDTVLYMRGASCTGPEIGCNDDAANCPVSTNDTQRRHGSRLRPLVLAGTTYYIIVDGYGGARGDFSLSITPPAIGVALTSDPDEPAADATDSLASTLAPQGLRARVVQPTVGCTADSLTDGAGCDTGDPCDLGVCRAAVCTPTSKPLDRPALDVKRLALRQSGARLRVVTKALFASAADPAKAGAIVDLTGPDGNVVSRLQLPGAAFRTNRARTRFRYVRAVGRKHLPKGVRLRRLTFRRHGDQLRMFLRASVPNRLLETAAPRVDLAIRVGPACASSQRIGCTPAHGQLACD